MDNLLKINPEATGQFAKAAMEKGFTVIPARDGHHWFPVVYLITELLGKSERTFERELTTWRRSGSPIPEKHPGANGCYYRLFDFLELYYEWKTAVR